MIDIRLFRPLARLVLYADPSLLPVLDRPRLSGNGPILELAPLTRLPATAGHISAAPKTRVSPRQAWRRVQPQLDGGDRRPRPDTVTLVCHLDDLEALLPHIVDIDDVRLLWHPADRPDAALEMLLRRVQDQALGKAIGPYPVYFCVEGRAADAEDWSTAAHCPVLSTLADTARIRRHRMPDPMRPTMPALREVVPPAPRFTIIDGGKAG